jgi:hypothetical protein
MPVTPLLRRSFRKIIYCGGESIAFSTPMAANPCLERSSLTPISSADSSVSHLKAVAALQWEKAKKMYS